MPGLVWPYAHFLYQERPGGPFRPRAFALESLPDNTVRFFVSPERPVLRSNDSYAGLISQIRAALAVWDAVPTSALRVEFRGFRTSAAGDAAPHGEILFAELPPGVLGLGGPETDGNGGRGPIIRSQVFLSNDLTTFSSPRPSYSERFFNSLVHEIGHALGLQHTLTGAAMSTEPTRATTRAQPLDVDDIAGISALYPAATFGDGTGAIEGRVAYADGEPAHLASVTALAPIGGAVSALTGVDGRFRVAGLPTGRYWLVAQPLPPATQDGLGPANLLLPQAADGTAVAAGDAFRARFHGGSADAAPGLVVAPGQTVRASFTVERRDSVPLHTVTTYSFPGNGAPGVHPAFAALSDPAPFVLATGRGDADLTGGGRVRVLGNDVAVEAAGAYAFDARFAQFNIVANRLSRLGPRHMVFAGANDFYLLPNAFRITRDRAPVPFWIQPSTTDPSGSLWTLRGAQFSGRSRVFFDGFEAGAAGFDPQFGELTVRAPAAPAGHRAVITVLNADGQSSAMTLPDGNVMAPLNGPPEAAFRLVGGSIIAGGDALLEIEASEAVFADGESWIGFASPALRVRQLEVESARKLLVVVSAEDGAGAGPHTALLINGLRVERAEGILAETADTNVTTPRARISYEGLVNSATGLPLVAPGSFASIYGAGFPGANEVVAVSFNGRVAQGVSVAPNQINLAVPGDVPAGPVRVQIARPEPGSRPMLATLEAVAPGVFFAVDQNGVAISAENPARAGERVTLVATGLPRNVAAESAAAGFRLAVLVGNARAPAESVARGVPGAGLVAVGFRLPERVGSEVRVAVWADGRTSNRIPLITDQQ